MSDTINLSDDALVFGFAYLGNSGSTLAFGGDHAKKEITPRARAALNELLAAGVVETAEPWDQWPGREYYRGKVAIGPLMKGRNLNPFDDKDDRFKWTTFANKE
jgi:hypothetical protein